MNTFKFLTFFACILVVFSCKDDDGGNACDFSSSAIAGEIEGVAWTLQEGRVELASDNTYSVDLFGMEEDLTGGVCNVFLGDRDRVFFSNLPAEEGEYALSFDFTSGLTVTLFSAATTSNVIASEGCVAVANIGADMVELKFNIDVDSDNSLTGSSMVSICQ